MIRIILYKAFRKCYNQFSRFNAFSLCSAFSEFFLIVLCKEYMDKCYEIQPDDRLFPYTKSFLNHEMLRGCKKSGVKKIRVHDLRHSHASLLIEMGCQPLLIADRLGHEKIQTTLNTYSHLYPNKQAEVAAQLENVMNGTTVPNGSQMAGVANL